MRNATDAESVRATPPDTDRDAGYGNHTLSNLAKLRPFMTYFCWVADRRYPAHHRPETRVANHRKECPRFYWTCVLLDMVLLVGVVVFALRAAYKSVWL